MALDGPRYILRTNAAPHRYYRANNGAPTQGDIATEPVRACATRMSEWMVATMLTVARPGSLTVIEVY
jgi:hypothetical protein